MGKKFESGDRVEVTQGTRVGKQGTVRINGLAEGYTVVVLDYPSDRDKEFNGVHIADFRLKKISGLKQTVIDFIWSIFTKLYYVFNDRK